MNRPDTYTAEQRLLITLDLSPLSQNHTNHASNAMNVQHADPGHLQSIESLLDGLDLPNDDLTPGHLDDFLVCQAGDELAGVVGLERYGDTALLRSLAVRSAQRGNGIGTQLTDQIEAHARHHGVTEVYLLTTTAEDFFSRRGYERIDRDDLPSAIEQTEEVVQLCPASATCMYKRLP